MKSSVCSFTRFSLAALSRGSSALAGSAALAGCAVLVGCAGFSRDGGFDAVAAAAYAHLGSEVRWPRSADERHKSETQVAALLARRLEVDDAVQIALLNNPGLQASFEELGISEADLVQSGRLPNPRFTLRHSSAGGLNVIEETLTFNVLSLLTAPYVHSIEKRRFSRMQQALVIQVVQLADRTRTAYFTALAARDSLHYAWQVKNAAQTGAELAHRMLGAGNWNRLDQARQQSFYAEAVQDLARAKLSEASARTDLGRLLGIVDERTDVQLAERLPDLPQNIAELPNIEQTAMQERIDLQVKRAEIDALALRLKLTKATRFVNVLDLGPTRVHEGTRQDPYQTGYEVNLEVPIFDTGGARVRKAEAVYAQSLDRLAQAAVDARAEVRRAAAQYRTAYEIALGQRDDIVPVRKLVTQQDLLRYNASLVSVFALLADAREEIVSVNGYIQSVRDFWIAKSHLDAVLIADSPG
jgi:outer membrane protein TolC